VKVYGPPAPRVAVKVSYAVSPAVVVSVVGVEAEIMMGGFTVVVTYKGVTAACPLESKAVIV
jgi:hypothetical protein